MKDKMMYSSIDLRLSKKDSLFSREVYKDLAEIVQSLGTCAKCDLQLLGLLRLTNSKQFFLSQCINITVNLKLFYRSVVLLSLKNIFSHLHTIDICNNTLSDLPDEFCNLFSLKECYLSYNRILYLPLYIGDLRSLSVLHLNSNRLCNLPPSIGNLSQLKELDLYDNDIREYPRLPESLLYLDLAQNYVEEPDDILYQRKRNRLRYMLGYERKYESKIFEDEYNNHKYYESDEEYIENVNYNYNTELQEEEDWESDDYWDPLCRDPVWPDTRHVWENFVHKVQREGGFVPSDLHVPSTEDRVSAVELIIMPGQFDDD